MKDLVNGLKSSINRRSFIKKGLTVAGAATVGAGMLTSGSPIFAKEGQEGSGALTQGDAAILRFAAAAEIIETDFWVQYNELGGIQDNEVPGGSGNPAYTAALKVLDGDMDQYIHDNTEDEFTHQNFINAYLASKGADTVDLSSYVTLPGSTATGSDRTWTSISTTTPRMSSRTRTSSTRTWLRRARTR